MDELDRLLNLAVEELMPSDLAMERVRALVTRHPLSPAKAMLLACEEQNRIYRDCFGRLSDLFRQGGVLRI